MMTKVYLLYSSNIYAQNGAAKFCRSISDYKYWKDKSVEFCVISNSNAFKDEQTYRTSKIHIFKKCIKELLGKTSLGKIVQFYFYEINYLGDKIVSQIDDVIDPDTIFILNDYIVADKFYRKYKDKYKSIFIMHNNGDLLSMLEEKYSDVRRIWDYLNDLQNTIFSYADSIVFVSNSSMHKFNNDNPKFKNKTCCIYNGIEDFLSVSETRNYDKLKLITIGTVCSRKNQIALIEAIQSMREYNLELTVVGDGPQYETCRCLVDKYGLSDRVFMVGGKNDVTPFLKKSNVFIMTSLDEGLPIAAQEAMQFCLPLILTDVGGCNELINGSNGFIIDNELESIKNVIKYMCNNLYALKKMGNESRTLFEKNFTLNSMLNDYNKLINKLSK